MSDLRVASIAGTDGTSPATLVKQSAAKAWFNMAQAGTLRASFNVSSITDHGTGDRSITLTNAMASANYGHPVSSGSFGGATSIIRIAQVVVAPTATVLRFITSAQSGSVTTSPSNLDATGSVHGDLA